MKKSLISIALLLLACICFAQNSNDLPLLKGKRILYIYGGWEGHEPKQCLEVFLPWLLAEGAIVDTSYVLAPYANEQYMDSIDLIIQHYTMSKLSKEQEKGLLTAVRKGVGIAGWHGGLGDSFRESVGYQFMIGGQWVAHPGNIFEYTVNISDKNDPVTKGLSDFRINSEQYYMHVDPNVKVLAKTTFTGEHAEWIDGAIMPVLWKKTYGKGRVFYSSLGHVAADFDVPEVIEIMKRGIKWASASKYEPKEKWMSPVYK